MAGCYAALRTGFISRRRAETAQPHSWTVPASMTNPRLSRERRRVSLAVAFWGATRAMQSGVMPSSLRILLLSDEAPRALRAYFPRWDLRAPKTAVQIGFCTPNNLDMVCFWGCKYLREQYL
jgi:hypothetical protein